MNSNLRKFVPVVVLILFLCCLGTRSTVQSVFSWPDEMNLIKGQPAQLQAAVPVQAQIQVDHPDVLQVNGSADHFTRVSLKSPVQLTPQHSGQAQLKLKLFGSIPLKTVNVHVVPDLRVFPGGQTIGVKVKSAGLLVVGHHLVKSGDNRSSVSPGEGAGIRLGDLITHINGSKVNDLALISGTIEQSGTSKKPLKVTLERNGKKVQTELLPEYDQEDRAWRLGLYVRNSAAGVGTLTFYAPDQGVYGALGHVITDMNTQTPIVVGSGEIVQSNVTSISKSESGDPGEKRANFVKESKTLGNIERNTHFGIFGKMTEEPNHSLYPKPIPVALASEVKEGPAEILTVVDGQKVQRYRVEIVHVSHQDKPATKGIVLRISDEKLIDKTGGIVQGMSGSPIIQNGKLIGAVTHVFVNDPKSGYGCFIEWMLQDAGVMLKDQQAPTSLKAS
ncbi:SpoIVB peptidase [Paenibacillus sp. JX-17]|uniref:SpoIVB peptidase n=1 Tax=Paenibacillus lacisoli TaxID=3064525 RepID=A0ABT9C7A6_9BACL|nr:SpoIVB peptidase [Paenibacillus sp. JX-17]MDO7905152.1 SpoIVB peptidase [Paenibacillus sp. JX-17]